MSRSIYIFISLPPICVGPPRVKIGVCPTTTPLLLFQLKSFCERLLLDMNSYHYDVCQCHSLYCFVSCHRNTPHTSCTAAAAVRWSFWLDSDPKITQQQRTRNESTTFVEQAGHFSIYIKIRQKSKPKTKADWYHLTKCGQKSFYFQIFKS